MLKWKEKGKNHKACGIFFIFSNSEAVYCYLDPALLYSYSPSFSNQKSQSHSQMVFIIILIISFIKPNQDCSELRLKNGKLCKKGNFFRERRRATLLFQIVTAFFISPLSFVNVPFVYLFNIFYLYLKYTFGVNNNNIITLCNGFQPRHVLSLAFWAFLTSLHVIHSNALLFTSCVTFSILQCTSCGIFN